MSAPLIIDCMQGSPAWCAARAGRLTGSVASAILATLKTGGEPAARRDLRTQLALERITGGPIAEDSYTNADMARGTALEPAARAAYEQRSGALVRQVGFLQHPELLAGCSPDGLIDDDGLLEIKCPRPANHLRLIRAGTVPSEHLAQITHNLWIAGADWCDYVSYCPLFPAPLDLIVIRVLASSLDLAAYELAARLFLGEVDAEVAAINRLLTERRDQ